MLAKKFKQISLFEALNLLAAFRYIKV